MDRDGEELRVAQRIQQQFLPRHLPELPGWRFAAHYQPAREVGGDFYDVTALPGGLIGLAVGDVAGKGIPAALLMATTHSVLRAEAYRLISPGSVLARINAQLVREMPPGMVTTHPASRSGASAAGQHTCARWPSPCTAREGGPIPALQDRPRRRDTALCLRSGFRGVRPRPRDVCACGYSVRTYLGGDRGRR